MMSTWPPAALYCLFSFVVLAIITVLLCIDANNPLGYLPAYRRTKGGYWRRCPSRIPGVPFMWARLYSLPDDGNRPGFEEATT